MKGKITRWPFFVVFFEDEIDEVVRQFGHFAKQFGFWKGPTGEGENRRRGSPVIDK